MNYLVVLFKNKKRKKIINKFITYDNAINFYNEKLEQNKSIIFDKRVENASDCSFELGLLQKKDENFDKIFVKDELGRQIKIEIDDPDYKIIKISNFKVEEFLFDVSLNKKIKTSSFLKTYLPKDSIKLVSSLNNKIVVQNDDRVNLFSLKNEEESQRFIDDVSRNFLDSGRIDTIFVGESSKEQKKYLYDLLSNMGFDKKLLYRRSTTFKPR